MLQMGFSQEEIQDSLVNQKYNDVMAAYLLLDYRNSEVHCFFLTHTHLKFVSQLHATHYWFVRALLAAVTLILYSKPN